MKLVINRKTKPKNEHLHKTINKNTRKKKTKNKLHLSRSSNIYDIDNFIIQHNAIKINQRHENLDIPIPIYREFVLDLVEEEYDVYS
jgi:hypothetical protein